ncbi:MAG: hypothetical protein JW862_19415 [Anaerolineales bacterium]|nr:hypothetical protein [Anaerolineales bacterium]
MLAPVVHVLPLTTIRRERVLPVPGKVLVRQGQRVAPQDVIAEANIAPEHLLLNLARSLRVSPKQADQLLQRQVDDEIGKGDLLAGPVGFARRVVRAPLAGRIVLAGDGQVLIEAQGKPFELRAGLAGVVTQLVAERGAIIETTGALIQGVWGNGQADFGLLQNKLTAPDEVLMADELDVSLRGSVILGGHCEDPKVLRNAAEIPLRGLILTSMAAGLIPQALKLPCPLVVLQGFGRLPMDSASYQLLTTNQNREVSVSAQRFDRFTGQRPEVIIPLPSPGDVQVPMESEDFAAGQRVRLVGAPQARAIGSIVEIASGLGALPSGIRAPAAWVKLEGGEKVLVPLVNLEVVA